ncbi:hypothetical protein M408DRAFT_78357 [Serendipita vermifera MAFF 305830]|uniref:AB hydrolase-1 domain-containing protein n=1 Tax=Serendipita vermifera MAFF 305830 TaxID=933852 RepID=A0A0C2X016_SERVB|nr:hypothetical protein M408DRAFT_78357 [Serendipita vermifera MAFF 305830]
MSRVFSYPKPDYVLPYESINPRPLHPLTAPTSEDAPQLPLGAIRRVNAEKTANSIPGYTLSTHIFQAAYPRTKCKTGPTPQFPTSSPTRKQDIPTAGAALEAVREYTKPTVYDDEPSDRPLWIEALENFKKTTFFQTWDPKVLEAYVNYGIGEDAAVALPGGVGLKTSSYQVRYHLTFIYFILIPGIFQEAAVFAERRAEMETWELLTQLEDRVGLLWIMNGKESKPYVSVTSSLQHLILAQWSCGSTIAQLCLAMRASLDTQTLFDSVILVDPVIHSPAVFNEVLSSFVPSAATINRRVAWRDREEAMETFRKSPFFQKWDPKVLEAYVKYGIGEDAATAPPSGVGLKTSSYQEAAVFSERRAAMEVWELLPQLENRIGLLWIMNGKESKPGTMDRQLPNSIWRRELTVWRREINTSNIRIRDSGHLIPQTMPDDLGESYLLGYITR